VKDKGFRCQPGRLSSASMEDAPRGWESTEGMGRGFAGHFGRISSVPSTLQQFAKLRRLLVGQPAS
jgi:hypothetical protein